MPLPESLSALSALSVLAELDRGDGVALPRLAKRLGLGVSVLMREFTMLSDAKLGGVAGPGYVRLALEEKTGRWVAHLTEAGRALP